MAGRKENGIQAQIIAGRDGKPSHAVVPVEVFLTLAALARESVQGSRKTARRTQMRKSLMAKQIRALQKHGGEFVKNLVNLFPDDRMEKTFAEVSDWLLSERDSAVDEEEDEDVGAYDAARARDEESFSEEVADRLIAGENPVKVFREYRAWTQRELAENIGTTAPYLSQIETGRRTGSVKLLHRLADALRVELDDLV